MPVLVLSTLCMYHMIPALRSGYVKMLFNNLPMLIIQAETRTLTSMEPVI